MSDWEESNATRFEMFAVCQSYELYGLCDLQRIGTDYEQAIAISQAMIELKLQAESWDRTQGFKYALSFEMHHYKSTSPFDLPPVTKWNGRYFHVPMMTWERKLYMGVPTDG